MDYILGTALGGLVAFAFAIPAMVLEWTERWKVRDVPLLVDVKVAFGRKLDRHESFLAALLLHVVIGSLFGLIYVLFVRQGWLVFTHSPYTLLSLVIYSFCAWLVTGLVVFPVLTLGLFGRRGGPRVWLEMLVSHYLIGLGIWLTVQYYQPVWFIG